MDKVKVILAVMKKQHFWVMCGLVLIIGLAGWAMATSKLWADYKRDRGKIEAEFKELETLRNRECENQDWIRGVQDQTVALKGKVKAAWDDVYAEQRDKVLKWPVVLGDDFLRLVPQLKPSEEIPVDQRERYWNYAREEFPRLLKIVDARSYLDKEKTADAGLDRARMPGGRQPPGERGRPAEKEDAPPEHDYKVVWDSLNQEAIDKRLEWTQTPTTQEVRHTQEDLWVYQSLLTIIAHLNDRADGHHNAKVKELRSLLIGREAAPEFQAGMAEGRVEHPDVGVAPAAGAPATLGMKPPGPGMPAGPGAMPRQGMMPGQAGREAAASLDEGRYVDEKGAPLAAGAAAPPEFRRMPIFIQLFMDQREISRLLVECGNSPLPVEVRQLRLTPAPAETAGGRPQPARGGASRPGLRMGGAARPRAAMQNNNNNNNNNDDQRDKSPYDVLVELHGIIYIFNPPDQAKLATAAAGAPTEEAPADGTLPADGPIPADAVPGEGPAPGAGEAADAAQPDDAADAADADARDAGDGGAAADDEG